MRAKFLGYSSVGQKLGDPEIAFASQATFKEPMESHYKAGKGTAWHILGSLQMSSNFNRISTVLSDGSGAAARCTSTFLSYIESLNISIVRQIPSVLKRRSAVSSRSKYILGMVQMWVS